MLICFILLWFSLFPPDKKFMTLTPPTPLPPFPFTHKAINLGKVGRGAGLGSLNLLSGWGIQLGTCLLLRRTRNVPFLVL